MLIDADKLRRVAIKQLHWSFAPGASACGFRSREILIERRSNWFAATDAAGAIQ
jgi:hypothetical protein